MKNLIFVLLGFVLFFISSCTEKYEAPSEGGDGGFLAKGGCVGCHTDKDLLKEVADPLPPPPDGGGEG